MKKILFSCLVLTILVTACSCKNAKTNMQIKSFSYSSDSQHWVKGEIGIKTDDFKNTIQSKIKTAKDALDLAENEVTVSYDQTAVCYDSEMKIWRVDFWTENTSGGNQIVYLNSDGTTKTCIWEE